ncbi:hypothetical protein GUJ93_ZPchr0013g35109 [Zizania palustris]|uniref:Uncharacterized protein n=1 Tax=Zizania palustris TaxID=103762 RepID=A0A8J6BY60_ZIZPA|nr:hypothetical protein GUJ93_ZPchr0013g35109 [Zizania palustris]
MASSSGSAAASLYTQNQESDVGTTTTTEAAISPQLDRLALPWLVYRRVEWGRSEEGDPSSSSHPRACLQVLFILALRFWGFGGALSVPSRVASRPPLPFFPPPVWKAAADDDSRRDEVGK